MGWLCNKFKITAVHSGQALAVDGGSTNNGANVLQWPYFNGGNFQWTVSPLGGGKYKLNAVHSGKALAVDGASTADGVNIVQYDCSDNGVDNDQWEILAP